MALHWLRSSMIAVAALSMAIAGGGAAASGQARHEGNTDPPILRSFYWFRYVAGRDIRDACTPGSATRIRAVYNALFNEQVRTYDIESRPDGTWRFAARVYADLGNVGSVSVSKIEDVAGPWMPRKSERAVSAAQFAPIQAALSASNAFGPPPKGVELFNNDFWWTVASCRNGTWGFQAYHYPTDQFARVRFAENLFALDGTGVAPNLPRALPPAVFRGEATLHWRLAVGADGLRDY